MNGYDLTVSKLIVFLSHVLQEYGDLSVVKTMWDGSTESKHFDVRVREACTANSPDRYDWVTEPGQFVDRRVVID